MDLIARTLLVGNLLSLLAVTPAVGQLSDELPHAPYYLGVQAFYSGEYRDAARILSGETRRGMRIGQARWVDSICYHAMLGEVLYHQGRNAEALAEFDQACQLWLAYPDWLLQVKFQQPPRPDANRARRMPPWGRSERQFALGQFPATEQVLIGDINANRAFQQGGVAAIPMFWRVNVAEVVRMTQLAVRRRNELLGPLATYDRIAKDVAETLSRGNLAPANHWSAAWIDLLRGTAQAGMGKFDEADKLLERAMVVDGRFDHPLTCVALLEQGRLAMARGNSGRAAERLAEAGFSAYSFENWDVLSESMWLGWMNHLTSGAAGVYPPLEGVAAWAQSAGLQHLTVKLRLAQAESLAWLGDSESAAVLLADTARRIDDMRAGLVGIHQSYVSAVLQLLGGQIGQGLETLSQALAGQQVASAGNFRIARTNEMFDAGAVSPRVAVELYASLLADPAATDWAFQPLEAMAVLSTSHDEAFDRWFVAALGRKELRLALEISEQSKRRRYLAAQPLGGRIAALRRILEAPVTALSKDALLQRQLLLASFPAYRASQDAAQRIYDKLRAGPLVAVDPVDARTVSALFDDWGKSARQREQMLAQLAPRRLPSSLEFPPLRTAAELQKSLGKGDALVVFHAAAGGLYGLLVTQDDVHVWQVRDARQLQARLGELLRALGNYGPNKQLSLSELSSDAWRKPAAEVYESVFGDSRLDPSKTASLTIVPDDLLWYVPFESLVPAGAGADELLADHVAVRYGPTAVLALPGREPLRRPQRTGIVANDLGEAVSAGGGDAIVRQMEKVVPGPVRLPTPMPEPGNLVAPLLDGLVSLDEIAISAKAAAAWSPMPRSRESADGAGAFGLPYGGPERVVITGLATEAERGLKSSRRTTARRGRAGDELFQPLCGMMADGARTILLTRWRTGGRTNLELVREFLRELPHSPAAEAWQRAVLLAREAPLDASREPRLKRADDSAAELPTADHPFFWAGYLLVDTAPPRQGTNGTPDDEDEVGAEAEHPAGKKLPPPSAKASEPLNVR